MMDSPLQLIRELLPFSQPDAEQQASQTVRGLLDTVAGLSPLATVARLTAEVLPGIAGQGNLHMRFKLLEDVRHEAGRALPALEAQLTQAVLPLPLDATSAAIHADNLIKGLAHAYTGVARNIVDQQQSGGLSHLYHRAIQRAMAMLARRQLLAYRAYATPSAAAWQRLHELYQLACDRQDKPLNGETAPIEHEYLSALLLAYIDPAKLPRSELDIINRCIHQLSAYAAIGKASPETPTGPARESCFLVRPDEGGPGHPLMRLPPGTSIFGGLIVDCSQVVAALDRNLARQPGQSVQPDLDAPPALLQGLRIAIGGKSARRFSRTRFRPRADLVGGLDRVIAFLDGDAWSRRSLDAQPRQAAGDWAPSEWSLIDESPDGFRLRFIKGEKWKIGAGSLVALQPRESSKIHVCLVRRIASAQSRLEIGLQLLSPQVSIADLRDRDGHPLRAVFLHGLPAYGHVDGLLAPPGRVAAGQPIAVEIAGRTLDRRIGQCMEANDGLEFFALHPLPD